MARRKKTTDRDVIAAFNDGSELDLSNVSPEVREQIEAATPEHAPDAETIAAYNRQKEKQVADHEKAYQKERDAAADGMRRAALLVQSLGDRVTAPAARAQERVARLPTPGGMAILVVILLVLVWAVIPVKEQDGTSYTRLGLLWLTLTGKTYIQGRRDVRGPFLPDQNTPVPPTAQDDVMLPPQTPAEALAESADLVDPFVAFGE